MKDSLFGLVTEWSSSCVVDGGGCFNCSVRSVRPFIVHHMVTINIYIYIYRILNCLNIPTILIPKDVKKINRALHNA